MRVPQQFRERSDRSQIGTVLGSEDSAQAARSAVTGGIRPLVRAAPDGVTQVIRRLPEHRKRYFLATVISNSKQARENGLRSLPSDSGDAGIGLFSEACQEFDQRLPLEQPSRAFDKGSMRVSDPVGVEIERTRSFTEGGLLRVGA